MQDRFLSVCFWYHFQCIVKPAPAVNPAACDLQIFTLLFQCMIYLVPIRNTDPGVIPQEFPGMGCITRFLVFIKDDLTIPVHKAGPVHPHVTLAAGRTPVLIYKYRSLILCVVVYYVEKPGRSIKIKIFLQPKLYIIIRCCFLANPKEFVFLFRNTYQCLNQCSGQLLLKIYVLFQDLILHKYSNFFFSFRSSFTVFPSRYSIIIYPVLFS